MKVGNIPRWKVNITMTNLTVVFLPWFGKIIKTRALTKCDLKLQKPFDRN